MSGPWCVFSVSLSFQAGIAVKPNTGIEVIQEYVCDADMVLVMTVEPGYGGQSFMPDMMSKVRSVRQMAPHLDIQVDGGVGPKTIDTCSDVSCTSLRQRPTAFS